MRIDSGTCTGTRLTAFLCLMVLSGILSNAGWAQTWTPKASLPTAREKLASCVIGHHIFAIGGTTAANQSSLNTNERYDTQTDTWTTQQPMPTARKELTASAVNGKCYVIGGSIGTESTPVATLEIYDPATNQWSVGASMPTARFYPVSGVIDGKIYVAGGASDSGQIFNDFQAYDPATNSWNILAPMPTPRAVSAAATLGGKLYVFGGTNSPFSQRFAVTERYDPITGKWSGIDNVPMALAAFSAAASEEKMFVVGGSTSTQNGVRTVYTYDPASPGWGMAAQLPGNRALHTVAFADGELFVIGGATSTRPPHPALSNVHSLVVSEEQAFFPINPGFSDAWYNPETDGQGFLISVFPVIGQVFLAWFTYDTDRPPEDVTAILGEPGHRWLTAQGPYSEDTANLTIYLTEGGEFDSAVPPATTDPESYGTLALEFADCTEGLVTYDIPSLDLSGVIPIQRVVPDNIELCEALHTE